MIFCLQIVLLYFWSGICELLVFPGIFAGENSIVIVSGANDVLSEDDVRSAKSLIASASVCVCQLEINPELTHFTLSSAKKAGGLFYDNF